MRDAAAVTDMVRNAGYVLHTHFTLPEEDWWRHYYTPLDAKLPALFDKYRDNEPALEVVRMAEREIQMRRKFAGWYGYAFFIARRAD
jgi:hypothetical protein